MKHKTRCLISFAAFLVYLTSSVQAQDSRVLLLDVNGAINPVVAEYIVDGVNRAEDEKFEALILQLDTPGGLLESTRDITKRFLRAKVPVIVYIAPDGARAASAGVFISYAAHFVAMAPSTNIGAAHPVNLDGSSGGDSTQTAMMEKVTNDAVAQVKGMAEKRGRNAEWAEDAVRNSVSITETEALSNNVINFIAEDVSDLLEKLDGMKAETESGEKILSTRNAEVISSPMSWRDRVLYQLSNPNLAYILLMIGFYGIYFELSNPGAILPGAVGAICLILAFYAMQTLPVNYAGLLLIVVAIILFILEVKIQSYGMLTLGGVAAMIIGSLMLFKSPEDLLNEVEVSLEIIIIFTLLTAGFFVFALGLAFRAHQKKVATGKEGLVGEIGKAQSDLDPQGTVLVDGELWDAYTDSEIHKGDRVKVVAVEAMRLKISKA